MPNGWKIGQMDIKYTIIFLPKFTQIGILGLKRNLLANPVSID
jgi:hypothetical protein